MWRLKGRIGLNSNFIENDEKDEFLPLPKDYEPDNVDLINWKSLTRSRT